MAFGGCLDVFRGAGCWGVGLVPWQEATFPSPHHSFTARRESLWPCQLWIQAVSSYQIPTGSRKEKFCFAEKCMWSVSFSWTDIRPLDTDGLTMHPLSKLKSDRRTGLKDHVKVNLSYKISTNKIIWKISVKPMVKIRKSWYLPLWKGKTVINLHLHHGALNVPLTLFILK